MSKAKKYTVYFPDPKLLDMVELWGRKQKLTLNESIRRALSSVVGYDNVSQDKRLIELEEKMESLVKFKESVVRLMKQQGVEL